jgi:hypothetical protein
MQQRWFAAFLLLAGCEIASNLATIKTQESRTSNSQDSGIMDAGIASRDCTESSCICAFEEIPTGVVRSKDTDVNHPICRTESCVTRAGSLVDMEFCCDKEGAWSQCVLRRAEAPTVEDTFLDPAFDLSGFDADNGRSGLLEVVVRLKERVVGLGLSLWYGKHPWRKKLVILTPADTTSGLGPKTITRYFRPEDADCADHSRADRSGTDFERAKFPARCVVSAKQGKVCPAGRWRAIDEACQFDYAQSWLYLTAESCAAEVRSAWSSFQFVTSRAQISARAPAIAIARKLPPAVTTTKRRRSLFVRRHLCPATARAPRAA